MPAHAQFAEIGPAPVTPAVARKQFKDLLANVDAGNRKQTITKLSGLLDWYRDLVDEELIAAWQGDNRSNLPEVIEALADPHLAAEIVNYSWREARDATFTLAYAPILGHLMERYPESAKPFLDDLLSAQVPNLSEPEAETVCRILLDMPDLLGSWKKDALQILPHYRTAAQAVLNRDLQGDDPEKNYRAQVWLSQLNMGGAPVAPRSPAAASLPRVLSLPPQAGASRGECVPPLPGMVGWWPGDSNQNDIAGGHNPSQVNAVKLAKGEVQNGFTFGTQGYIEIPQSPALQNQRFTWLAWARPDGPGPNASSLIINQNIDGSHASVALGWRAADQRFTFLSGEARTESIISRDVFPAHAFYFVAGTYDGIAFRLFVNGVLEGALAVSRTVPYSSYGWEIGSGTPRGFPGSPDTWNGVIDELQAYNRALTAAEIQSIFNAGGAGVCKSGATPGNLNAAAPPPSPPAAGQAGATLKSLDPLAVEDAAHSVNGNTPALIEFVNRSSGPVDIYWINYQGNRRLDRSSLPVGATFTESTFLTHPFLVVASGTGGTTAQDTGTRLAAFEAQTANPNRDPAARDTAIISNADGTAAPSAAAIPSANGPGSMDAAGVYKPGNGVSPPSVLTKADPEYSELARKLSISGSALLSIVIDASGIARDIQVIRGVGYGLDEKAAEAVRKWRFKPGMKDGAPVPTRAQVEINFQLVGRRTSDYWYFSGPIAFAVASGVTPPMLKDVTMPKAVGDSAEQSVVLGFTVDARGSVKNILTLDGPQAGAELLTRNLALWKFQPALNGGTPVEATGTVRFVKGQADMAGNAAYSSPPRPQPPANAAPPSVESVSGTLRRLAERDLLLQTTSGKVLRFRLILRTEFRSTDGKPVRDSPIHPGDRIRVEVSADDVETAIAVVVLAHGSSSEREGASAAVDETRIATPEPADF